MRSPPARTLLPRLDSLDAFREFRGPVDLRDKHYLASAGFVGILGLLPALAFLFMWLGVGAWGWMKRMGGGVCCQPSVKGYTAREKFLPKLAYYVTTGLFLVGAGLIFFAGFKLMKKGNGVQEALNARSETLILATQLTIVGLRAARSSFFDQDFVNGLGSLGLQFRDGMEVLAATARSAKTVGDGIYFGETAILGATIVLCLLSAMNTIATCLRLSRMLFLLLGFGVVMCFVCWLCFGAVFVLDVVFRDICFLAREKDAGRRVSEWSRLAPLRRAGSRPSAERDAPRRGAHLGRPQRRDGRRPDGPAVRRLPGALYARRAPGGVWDIRSPRLRQPAHSGRLHPTRARRLLLLHLWLA